MRLKRFCRCPVAPSPLVCLSTRFSPLVRWRLACWLGLVCTHRTKESPPKSGTTRSARRRRRVRPPPSWAACWPRQVTAYTGSNAAAQNWGVCSTGGYETVITCLKTIGVVGDVRERNGFERAGKSGKKKNNASNRIDRYPSRQVENVCAPLLPARTENDVPTGERLAATVIGSQRSYTSRMYDALTHVLSAIVITRTHA